MNPLITSVVCETKEIKAFKNVIFETKSEKCNEHSHNSFAIYYCQRGNFSNFVNEKYANLNHGDIMILPPGQKHQIKINTAQTVIYMLYFPIDYIMKNMKSENSCHIFLKELLLKKHIYPKLVLPPEEIVFFECMLNKIVKEAEYSNDDSDELIKYCISAMLTIMARLCAIKLNDKTESKKSNEQFIDYCISFADAHCTNDISLESITKLSAMSKAVFCNMFKEKTGLSFKGYLNRKRIQKAMALIKDGEKITNVSQLCGYSEFSTFYRNFVKYTGTTPKKYKINIIDKAP